MATRMQQRRGTAAQWISTNGGAGPVLNAGEMGWESDTNKFKIGDGVNNWTSLDYFSDINSTVDPAFGSSITFEGTTANAFETTLTVTDPTADRTITFPDATGTVALTSDIAELSQDAVDAALTAGTGITKTYNDGANTLTIAVDTTTIQARVADVSDTEIGYLNGVTSAIQTQLDDKSTASKTETLTNKSISLASNTVTSTLAQLNTAISDADVATLAGTETLTNKTLTTPTINGGEITATGGTPRIHGIYLPESHFITFEGATNNEFETVLTTIDPTADRTISLPDGTGTLALTSYVDSVAQGLHIHASVVAATTANITLATDVENGDVLDGVTLATGNRILVKNQSTASENGIYVVAASGAPTRATDFDSSAEIQGGDFVFVTGGTVNDNTGYVQTSVVTTVGTDPITFSQFSGAGTFTAGTGLTLTGTVFSINTGTTADLSTAQTLTNKTVNLTSNTLTGTIAQFNTALSDADFATLAGSETLTNKTLSSAVLSGTITIGGSTGTAGQILKSTGSGIEWGAAASSGGAAFSELMLIGA